MATRLVQITRNQVVAAAGTAVDPALRDIVGGVEALVAPDIVIMVPKATATPAFVPTVLAVGAITLDHAAAGNQNFDVVFLRLHSIQRVLAGLRELYADIDPNVAIANGAGTAINPLLVRGGVAQVPDICIPIPKAAPGALTRQTYVSTVLAAGAITIQHGEGAPVNHDVLFLQLQDLFKPNVGGAPTDPNRGRRFYMTILDAAAATEGAVYEDRADTTRQFIVTRTKVTLDGSLQLDLAQLAGATAPGAAGDLDRVSGAGDAAIAWTARKFEKLVDLQQNVAVANGAGLVFDPGLVENGVAVMPDIVIPIPKAANIVPWVPTDLTGAVGNVTVQHQGGAPANHDILSIRFHSIQRDL